MPMTAKGLAKLLEETGELQQVIGKRLAYYHTDVHPDGAGLLSQRLEDEAADVDAALRLVAKTMKFDMHRYEARVSRKLALFRKWHEDPTNNENGIDRGSK